MVSAILLLTCLERRAHAGVIAGPPLTYHAGSDGSAWAWDLPGGTGLSLTALTDSVLTGFVLNIDNRPVWVELLSSDRTVLYSMVDPGDGIFGVPHAYTESVNWALTANADYFLVERYAADGYSLGPDALYTLFTDYPQSDAELRVNGAVTNSYGNFSIGTHAWFAFTELTTSPAPEPGTFVTMLGSALLLLGLRRMCVS